MSFNDYSGARLLFRRSFSPGQAIWADVEPALARLPAALPDTLCSEDAPTDPRPGFYAAMNDPNSLEGTTIRDRIGSTRHFPDPSTDPQPMSFGPASLGPAQQPASVGPAQQPASVGPAQQPASVGQRCAGWHRSGRHLPGQHHSGGATAVATPCGTLRSGTGQSSARVGPLRGTGNADREGKVPAGSLGR
jgi:hypothetical protein